MIVFILAFIGFGSKAGIFPFHIWLPHAHPAAPAPGYPGRFPAQKSAARDAVELVAVVDTDESAAKAIAEKLGVDALTDYRSLLGKVDAVSIAAPTTLHYQITKDFLQHGSHVLIEKPITVTVDEADDLIEIALVNDRLIQVGHLERFNAALLNIGDTLETPTFIESLRISIGRAHV